MSNLVVDKANLKKNFEQNKAMIAAEPAYILLAAYNHPDAHEVVRELTLQSQLQKKPFIELFFNDKSLNQYIKKFNKKQIELLKSPEKYVGIAKEKTDTVCDYWRKEFKI